MKGNKEHMNLTGHRTFIRFIHQFLVNTYSTQKFGGFKAAKNNEKWSSGSGLRSSLRIVVSILLLASFMTEKSL